jgi:hypothetical protein
VSTVGVGLFLEYFLKLNCFAQAASTKSFRVVRFDLPAAVRSSLNVSVVVAFAP